MPVPVLAAYTMRRGSLTLAGAGGVPLGQFMQTGGDTATGWAIVSGNPGTALAINATTGAVTPVASGGFGSGTWTLGIQATNASGTSNTATLTITTAANTYTVATPADVDTGLRSTTGVKAALGGKTVEIARGADAAFAGGTLLQWRAFNTHTGRFTITNEDFAHPTKLTKCWFYGLQRCDVLALWVSYGIDTVYDDTGLSGAALTAYQSARQALQGVFHVMLIYNASNGICADVVLDGQTIGAGATYTDAASWISGLSTIGGGAGFEHQNITVRNCQIARVKDGHNWGATTNYLFENNTIDRFCSNANFAGTGVITDAILQGNRMTRPMFSPADPGDHPDFCQLGGSLATADWYRIKVRNCLMLTLDGTGLAQGPFSNDLGYNGAAGNTGTIVLSNGQRLTGFQFHDCELSGILYDGGTLGITFDLGDGWLVERCTVVRGKLASTQLKAGAQYSDPYFRADALTQTGAGGGTAGTPAIPYGIIRNSVTHFQPAATAGFAQTNNTYMGATGLPTDAAGISAGSEGVRAAFLAQWFQDPGNDDPTIGYRAKTTLKNGDGTYRGALFPDGTFNNGSAFSGGITMTKQVSTALLNGIANAYEATIGTSPKLRLYSGTQPALTTDAATGTLLAEALLPADWMSSASGGAAALLGTWTDTSNDASGTATYYRLVASDGVTVHEQGSVGTSGADLNLSSTTIVANGSFTVTSWARSAAVS